MRALTRSALLLALLAGVVVVPPALAQDPDPVEVGNIFFEPEALTVDVGDTVTWEWVGGFHNVVSDGCGEGRTTPDGCYTNAAGEVFDIIVRFMRTGRTPLWVDAALSSDDDGPPAARPVHDSDNDSSSE